MKHFQNNPKSLNLSKAITNHFFSLLKLRFFQIIGFSSDPTFSPFTLDPKLCVFLMYMEGLFKQKYTDSFSFSILKY